MKARNMVWNLFTFYQATNLMWVFIILANLDIPIWTRLLWIKFVMANWNGIDYMKTMMLFQLAMGMTESKYLMRFFLSFFVVFWLFDVFSKSLWGHIKTMMLCLLVMCMNASKNLMRSFLGLFEVYLKSLWDCMNDEHYDFVSIGSGDNPK